MPAIIAFISILMEIFLIFLARAIKQEKQINFMRILRGGVKLSLS